MGRPRLGERGARRAQHVEARLRPGADEPTRFQHPVRLHHGGDADAALHAHPPHGGKPLARTQGPRADQGFEIGGEPGVDERLVVVPLCAWHGGERRGRQKTVPVKANGICICCATPAVTTILGAWPNAARRRSRPTIRPPSHR